MKDKAKKKVIGHLKEDMKTFSKERYDDKELIRSLTGGKKTAPKKKPKKQNIESRYHESSAMERKEHGYKKPKNPKASFERFKRKEKKKNK